jgi:hypothetical protein
MHRQQNPSSKIFKLYQNKVSPEALALAKATLVDLGVKDFNKKSPFDSALPWFLHTLHVALLDQTDTLSPEKLPDALASFMVLQERQRLFGAKSGMSGDTAPVFAEQGARLLGEMLVNLTGIMVERYGIESDDEIPFAPLWLTWGVMPSQFIGLDDIAPGLEAMRVVTDYYQQKVGMTIKNCFRFHSADSAMGETYKQRSLDNQEQNWAFLLDGRVLGMITIEIETGDGDYVRMKERDWCSEDLSEEQRKEAIRAVLEEVAVDVGATRVLVLA